VNHRLTTTSLTTEHALSHALDVVQTMGRAASIWIAETRRALNPHARQGRDTALSDGYQRTGNKSDVSPVDSDHVAVKECWVGRAPPPP
jgi:hypothetical protein